MATELDVTVLCDRREIGTGIIEKLQALGAQVKVGDLEAGDFVISGDMAIERKQAHEFVESINDGRLYNQVGKIRLCFKRPVFLVSGDVYSTRTGIRREAIDSALALLATMDGVTVLYVRENDTAGAANLIYRLAKHAQAGQTYEVAFRRGKVEPGIAQALFAIEGLPGVGPATAVKALNHFRSVHAVINASIDDLCAVPGIGRSKAQKLFESIHWRMPEGVSAEGCRSLFVDQV
jgi:ERCC4-type nuclease